MTPSTLLRSAAALLFTAGATAAQLHFQDASIPTGVEFVHEDGAFSYAMGGGVAWFDADRDGDEDLFVTSSTGRHRLYENDRGAFVNVTDGSNLSSSDISNIGVIAADYDQDGLIDLYLTNNGPNQLFRNVGGMVFEDVAPQLGVDGSRWSTSASWADFDGDLDLDLYVGNYIDLLNFPYHFGEANDFYLNVGTPTEPAFVEMAVALGIADTGVFGPTVPDHPYVSPEGEPTAGCTLSVCTLDYDEDGDPDLMVGNDFGLWVLPDRFFRNDTPPGGAPVFTDITSENFFGIGKEYNMGINGADYDHDGDWDFYLSNLGDNLLLRDVGSIYVDVAANAGPLDGDNDAGTEFLTSWGTVWGDYDNDGWEDLIVVNGYIPAASFIANDNRAPNHLWMNQGNGTFQRVDPVLSGMNDEGAGRGIGSADVNRDGLLDFYVMNNGAGGVAFPEDRCRLFMNEGTLGNAADNNYVALRLQAQFGNWEAIGSRVEAKAGAFELKRQVLGDPVFISSGTREVHFGLGANALVDELNFTWPTGRESRWITVPAGLDYEVLEPLVLLETVEAPVYQNNRFRMGLSVVNDSDESQQVGGLVQLHLGAGGTIVATFPFVRDVAPGATEDVLVQTVLTTELHDLVVGLEFEQRIYVVARGGLDSSSQLFAMP